MATAGRDNYLRHLFCCGTCDVRYHCGDSLRSAAVQAGGVCSVAVRARTGERAQGAGLPVCCDESGVDTAGVVGDCDCAPRVRAYLLHYHRGHSVGSAAFQNGYRSGVPLRQGDSLTASTLAIKSPYDTHRPATHQRPGVQVF